MAVILNKGQKVDLTKGHPQLRHVGVGLGWDPNKFDSGSEFDLDATAFLLSASGKVASDADFVFYKNKKHSSSSVVHMGDSLTGAGDGDDETIKIDLSKVPVSVARIAFCATIYEADKRNQNFGMVQNSYIRIYDDDTGEELCRYDLGEDFSVETAVVAGELYRYNNEWKFNAIGSGFSGGLRALCVSYGVDVD